MDKKYPMRKLTAFNFTTLNGFYKGPNEDIGWHTHDKEELKYSEEMLALNNILLFGRKTYEHMASFWPTAMAMEMFPKVADAMNEAEKIVFSHTHIEAGWKNTQLINGDIAGKVKQLKLSPGKDLTVLGSGSIVNLFTERKLIDEYQVMIDPVAIGKGTTLFSGIKNKLTLELTNVKTFKSGVILLYYKPF
jgi:dihydrofolate reductase